MSCPHLEETSALFDGVADERARVHAESCTECSAFLGDATQLRSALRAAAAMDPLSAPPRRRMRFAVPAFAVLTLVLMLFWIARPRPEPESGVFAGLDGGGRASIVVREVAR